MKVLNFSKAASANDARKVALELAAQALQQSLNEAAGRILEVHAGGTDEQLRSGAAAFAAEAFNNCYAAVQKAYAAGAFDTAQAKVKRDFGTTLVTHRAHCVRHAAIAARAKRDVQREAWAWLATNSRTTEDAVLAAFEALGARVVASCWMGNEDLPDTFRACLTSDVRGVLGEVLGKRTEALEQAKRQVEAEKAAAHDQTADARHQRANEVFAKAGIELPAGGATTTADMRAAWATAAGLGEHATTFALDTSLSDPRAAQLVIAEAHEVKYLGSITGQPALAASLIRARKSPAEARAALQDALAEADEVLQIQPGRRTQQPKPALGSEINVFAIYDRMNGKKA
jgi:hypothetical protein